MSDLEVTLVPKELYYHEVAYVRGLEKEIATLRARVAELEAALRVTLDAALAQESK